MTTLRSIKRLLKDEWTEDISGRDVPVSQPAIITEKESKQVRLEDEDYVYVKDGGVTDKDPAGLGWSEERKTSRVTLDVRTTDNRGGRTRLFGDFAHETMGDNTMGSAVLGEKSRYESENYGGLLGEVERIVDVHRKGFAGYHLVVGYEASDLSREMGFGRYRAIFELRLRTGPTNLNPPASNP